MRYVPVSSLLEGMVTGKNLYDKNHKLLLRKGAQIHKRYINRIVELGYQGMYIDDDVSKDIELRDIISEDLRFMTVKSIKDMMLIDTNDKHRSYKINKTKQLINQIVEEILDNQDAIINLIDLKFYDDYTFFHSVNVAVLSIVIGTAIDLNKQELIQLGIGAVLHDIGKMFVDKEILNKKGKLTDEELKHLQRHSEFGYQYLKETYELPMRSCIAVLQHHERYDGNGYPNQLAKDEISLFARIITIADVYDALISKRPYRKALLPSEAMEYIMANGGLMFDVDLVKVFVRKVAPYPIGTLVKLSNGYSGIVKENNDEACLRPMIKIIKDPKNKPIKPRVYDLKKDKRLRSVTIIGTLDTMTSGNL